MKLADYLEGMRAAQTAAELEEAIQAPFKHAFHGRTWTTISKLRIEVGKRIVTADALGFYVPQFGDGRRLTVCGETYRVGRGQNSTGVRYCWSYAGTWAIEVLKRHGLSTRAANRVWDGCWQTYPHRVLASVAAAIAGEIPDPELGLLIRRDHTAGPIRYTVELNEADAYDYRANRPCECGGVLFDWGGGHSEGFEFVNWWCNAGSHSFTEYMDRERFYALRQRPRPVAETQKAPPPEGSGAECGAGKESAGR